MIFCHRQDIRWGGFSPLQRYNRRILQLQPTGNLLISNVSNCKNNFYTKESLVNNKSFILRQIFFQSTCWMYRCLQLMYRCGTTHVAGDKDNMKKWRHAHTNEKRETPDPRKIPLTLLLLQHPSTPVLNQKDVDFFVFVDERMVKS